MPAHQSSDAGSSGAVVERTACARGDTQGIRSITITTFTAASSYPGCDYAGTFSSIQQSKMSLQYGVSAALRFGQLDDVAYSQFDDTELVRLIAACNVRIELAYDTLYPSAQPACITVQLADGRVLEQALDDVPWLDDARVNARYASEAQLHAPADSVSQVSALLSGLWDMPDLAPLFDALVAENSRIFDTCVIPVVPYGA